MAQLYQVADQRHLLWLRHAETGDDVVVPGPGTKLRCF